uniref:Homeobox domain-containing protein n=1 Tax=Lepisosteus oculatus TaxID=7918 RepID=W5LYP4_LEPOC
MEEWNSLPNYSSAYHTYAYGMTYPPPPVQNHPSLGWSGTGFTPSGSDGLFLDVPPTAPQNALPQDATRVPGVPLAGSPSDSSSETEPSTPDSWSSPSTDESYALRPPPAPCSPAETACAEPAPCSPAETACAEPAPCSPAEIAWAEPASSSQAEGVGEQGALLEPGPALAAGKRSHRLRMAYSERQVMVLCECYMIKMYLTPAEMKSLADKIGLSYKQVKSWFQNRRMREKRLQKKMTSGGELVLSSVYPSIQAQASKGPSSVYPKISPQTSESLSSVYPDISPQMLTDPTCPYSSIPHQPLESSSSVYPNISPQVLVNPSCCYPSIPPRISESPSSAYPYIPPQVSPSSVFLDESAWLCDFCVWMRESVL